LLIALFLAWHFAQVQKRERPVGFSELMAQVESGQVEDVAITGNEIRGHYTNRSLFRTFAPMGHDKLVDALLARNVSVVYQPDQTPSWANMLIAWAPFILLIGFGIFFLREVRRAWPNRSDEDLIRLLAQRAELEQLLAEARRVGTPSIVRMLLPRDPEAGQGESPRLVVPSAVDLVRLQLEIGRGLDYQSYRAVIRTPEGDQIWGSTGLPTTATSLILEVAARGLPAGEYRLHLSGSTRAGVTEDIASYSFSVVTR
jgi:hypothetical protein